MKKITILSFLLMSLFAFSNTQRYRITLTDDPSSTIMIGWEQVSGTNAIVYYGTTDHGDNWANYTLSKTVDRTVSDRGMTNQFAKLTGLSANTNYYFVIKDSDETSARFYFRTAPDTNDEMSFISGGDSRNNRTTRQNANKLVAKLKPTAIFFGGDMTNGDSDTEWQNWFDDWQLTIAQDGRMFPIVPARGNHEYNNNRINNLFNTPIVDNYYKLTFGADLYSIYTLNSEITAGGNQATWLTNELQNDNSVWESAQYHKPMRPHVGGKSEGNDEYNNWAQLFHDYGVKLVFESDSHTVKSTWPIKPCSSGVNCDEGFERDDANGTVYVGEGCWGAPLRSSDDSKVWSRDFGSFNQFKWVSVSNNKIDIKTIIVDNADAVGENPNNNVSSLPSGTNVWNPSNGDTITILRSGLAFPEVEITSQTNNEQIPNGTNVLIQANASDTDGTIAKVEFYINDVLESTDTTAPYEMNFNFSDGPHVVKAVSFDNHDFRAEETINLYVGNYSDTINQTAGNDVEQKESDGTIYNGSSDLELVYDSYDNQGYQTIGLRFNNLNIPNGAQITTAYIQFKAKSSHSSSVDLNVSVENSTNSLEYENNSNLNVTGSNRLYFPTTTWDVNPWTSGDAGVAQRTPSLVNSIQSLVNNVSWDSDNAISVKIEGTGDALTNSGGNIRSAYSINNSDVSRRPKLVIEYAMNAVTLSTTSFEKIDIAKIYPNPFKDVITFKNLNNSFNNAKVVIYDLNGKAVYNNILKSVQLNLNFLVKGVYILTLKNKTGELVTKKIIKE